jgi:hypothetical protein
MNCVADLLWRSFDLRRSSIGKLTSSVPWLVPRLDWVSLFHREFLAVSCPIFPSILIAKNLLTGNLRNRSIDYLETQKKSISMKNSQFFDYLLYAQMSIMTDDEKVEVLANTEIDKWTRLTKYYRVQNMILGTNMT